MSTFNVRGVAVVSETAELDVLLRDIGLCFVSVFNTGLYKNNQLGSLSLYLCLSKLARYKEVWYIYCNQVLNAYWIVHEERSFSWLISSKKIPVKNGNPRITSTPVSSQSSHIALLFLWLYAVFLRRCWTFFIILTHVNVTDYNLLDCLTANVLRL